MVAGREDKRSHEGTFYIIYMYRLGCGQGEAQRAVGSIDTQAVDRFVGYGADHVEEARGRDAAAVVGLGGDCRFAFLANRY